MDTKQIINGLLDRADRVADQSAGRIMKRAAKRLEELQKHNDALECERQAWLHDQERQRWIPVTEWLPDTIPCDAGTEYSEAVNVLTDGRKVLTAIWNGSTFLCDADYWEAWGEKITHWTPVLLPLPETPKEV